MTTRRPLKTPKTPPADRPADPDPLPDPSRVPDMQQNKHVARADQTLETWFHGRREDVLVNGRGYLCPDRRNVRSCPVPDCVVAFDVDPERIANTNGYVISEVGKPPELVLEVASRSTGARDYTVKRTAYARYEIPEYWRFDQSGGDWHDAPLAGDALVDGVYVPIPIHREPSGLIWGHSEVLNLDVCWDERLLRFYDPEAGRFLPVAEEMQLEMDNTRLELDAARDRAEAAEAEARRLREELRRLQG